MFLSIRFSFSQYSSLFLTSQADNLRQAQMQIRQLIAQLDYLWLFIIGFLYWSFPIPGTRNTRNIVYTYNIAAKQTTTFEKVWGEPSTKNGLCGFYDCSSLISSDVLKISQTAIQSIYWSSKLNLYVIKYRLMAATDSSKGIKVKVVK